MGRATLDMVFVSPQPQHEKLSRKLNPFRSPKRKASGPSLAAGPNQVRIVPEESEFKVTHDSLVRSKEPKRPSRKITNPLSRRRVGNQLAAQPQASTWTGPKGVAAETPSYVDSWGDYFDFYEESEYGSSDADSFYGSDSNAGAHSAAGRGSTLAPNPSLYYETDELDQDMIVTLPGQQPKKGINKVITHLKRTSPDRVVEKLPQEKESLQERLVKTWGAWTQSLSETVAEDPDEITVHSDGRPLAGDFGNIVGGFRSLIRRTVILGPLDKVADVFPDIRNVVVLAEIVIVMWVLYQVSVLIETLALAIRAICMPLILVGRLFGYF